MATCHQWQLGGYLQSFLSQFLSPGPRQDHTVAAIITMSLLSFLLQLATLRLQPWSSTMILLSRRSDHLTLMLATFFIYWYSYPQKVALLRINHSLFWLICWLTVSKDVHYFCSDCNVLSCLLSKKFTSPINTAQNLTNNMALKQTLSQAPSQT